VNIRPIQLFHGALILLAFALVGVAWPALPDTVPVRWDFTGQVVATRPRPWAFTAPVLMALLYGLLLALPRISPRGFEMERFRRSFETLQTTLLAFLLAVTALTLLASTGTPIRVDQAAFACIGLVLLVVGNFQGKLSRNFFLGVRTPWTLASEEVWLRTNRLAGRLMVACGVVLLAAAPLGGAHLLIWPVVAIAAGVPIAYSYLVYRRLEG
jgi:uncharacterized membrane protein